LGSAKSAEVRAARIHKRYRDQHGRLFYHLPGIPTTVEPYGGDQGAGPALLTKQHLRNRFERECKAQGMLGNHQNVVTIFGAGFDKSGRPYIIMEYLPKGSLTNRLKTGPLRWQEVSRLG
jgi:serine/threonine protein kinase